MGAHHIDKRDILSQKWGNFASWSVISVQVTVKRDRPVLKVTYGQYSNTLL